MKGKLGTIWESCMSGYRYHPDVHINTTMADIKQAIGQNANSGHLGSRVVGGFHFFPSVSSNISIMTTYHLPSKKAAVPLCK